MQQPRTATQYSGNTGTQLHASTTIQNMQPLRIYNVQNPWNGPDNSCPQCVKHIVLCWAALFFPHSSFLYFPSPDRFCTWAAFFYLFLIINFPFPTGIEPKSPLSGLRFCLSTTLLLWVALEIPPCIVCRFLVRFEADFALLTEITIYLPFIMYNLQFTNYKLCNSFVNIDITHRPYHSSSGYTRRY